MSLKVVHVIGSKKAGGAETFFVRMMRALQEASVDTFVVVRQDSWLQSQMEKYNIPHAALPFGGLLDIKTKTELKKIIEAQKPAVVQSWMNRASRFIPKVEGVVNVGRLGGYYSLKYYKNMDWLVGNTEDICRYVKTKGWPEDKAEYIPNFAPEPVEDYKLERNGVRDTLGIPEDAYTIFLAGRLHENKGFDIALYAMRFMPDNVHTIVAGEGPDEDTLKTMVESDGYGDRVHFVGWVNNITALAAASDVWMVPSRHEPLGNVVLDAWMHEMPVIASESDGPKSLIDDRKTGLLVPVGKGRPLAAAVKELMEHPELANQLAHAGKVKGEHAFSQEVVLQQWLSFYVNITTPTEDVA